MTFDYNRAFSRNLGLVTADEQIEISKKTIAIAGMGGVGDDAPMPHNSSGNSGVGGRRGRVGWVISAISSWTTVSTALAS